MDFARGINFCVNQLRAALGDAAEKPLYIETLPRVGYRFLASVTCSGSIEASDTDRKTSGADQDRFPGWKAILCRTALAILRPGW